LGSLKDYPSSEIKKGFKLGKFRTATHTQFLKQNTYIYQITCFTLRCPNSGREANFNDFN